MKNKIVKFIKIILFLLVIVLITFGFGEDGIKILKESAFWTIINFLMLCIILLSLWQIKNK